MFALNEGNKGRPYRNIAKGTTIPAIGQSNSTIFTVSLAFGGVQTVFNSF